MNKLISKKIVIVILLTVFILAGCDNSPSPSPSPSPSTSAPAGSAAKGQLIGNIAPDFTLTNMSGQQVSLSQYRGKVVILNFWATWCPPCREEMPSMEALYQKYTDQGLVILAVNIDENGEPAVRKFLMKTPYSFPILLDSKNVAQNIYGVFRFPESFIIDREGIVVEKIIGGRDWISTGASKMLDFLLNG